MTRNINNDASLLRAHPSAATDRLLVGFQVLWWSCSLWSWCSLRRMWREMCPTCRRECKTSSGDQSTHYISFLPLKLSGYCITFQHHFMARWVHFNFSVLLLLTLKILRTHFSTRFQCVSQFTIMFIGLSTLMLWLNSSSWLSLSLVNLVHENIVCSASSVWCYFENVAHISLITGSILAIRIWTYSVHQPGNK